jgi:hypothetical protein
MTDLAFLLDEIDEYISRFVVMSKHQRTAISLWVFHTWVFEAADTTPYITVSSPTPQCGKTRLFEVLELLVCNPEFGANHTEATLFRTIEESTPTLLLDEIDQTFAKDAKLYAGVLGVLNTGYRRGATIPRNVGEGTKMKLKKFRTFCPKAFAGIGSLPSTVADRSIPVRLQRKAKSDTVERFRERRERKVTEALRSRFGELCLVVMDALRDAEPGLPDALSDRQQDVWEPLLAIADLAAGPWPGWARAAAISLHEVQGDEHDAIRLLADMHYVFDGHKALPTKDVVRGLVDIEDAPYAIWWAKQVAEADANPDKSPGLWQSLGAKLSRELKGFNVKPKDAYDGERKFKGYERSDLEPLWERYLLYPSEVAELAELAETPGSDDQHFPLLQPVPRVSRSTGGDRCPDCGAMSAEAGYAGHANNCPRFHAKENP